MKDYTPGKCGLWELQISKSEQQYGTGTLVAFFAPRLVM